MFDSTAEAYIRRLDFFCLHIWGLLPPGGALKFEGDGVRQGIGLVHT